MRQPRPLHLGTWNIKSDFFTLARKGDLGGSSVLGVRIVFRRGGQAWAISYREKKNKGIFIVRVVHAAYTLTGVPTRLLISSFAFELKIRTQAGIFTLKMSSTHWASSVFVYGEKQNLFISESTQRSLNKIKISKSVFNII